MDLIDSQPPTINGTYPVGRTAADEMNSISAPLNGTTKGYTVGWVRANALTIMQKYPFRLQIAAIFGSINKGDTG